MSINKINLLESKETTFFRYNYAEKKKKQTHGNISILSANSALGSFNSKEKGKHAQHTDTLRHRVRAIFSHPYQCS